jgi:hypothetical protein
LIDWLIARSFVRSIVLSIDWLIDFPVTVSCWRWFYWSYSGVFLLLVVVDEHGDSRGYGFVRFADETDQQRALNEMQGVIIGNKPIRVSIAAPKKWVFSALVL